jgi:hypothetical protein
MAQRLQRIAGESVELTYVDQEHRWDVGWLLSMPGARTN